MMRNFLALLNTVESFRLLTTTSTTYSTTTYSTTTYSTTTSTTTTRTTTGSTDIEAGTDPLKTGTDIEAVKAEHKNATETGVLRNDGFSFVDCVNDKMLVSGDKFGNPMSWDKDTPISVIRYDKTIGNVKQQEMTHEVCFDFCKKFENIKYFGIVNGNDCYCTPFFDITAGDGGHCDVKCQGDASQLCGGQAKASVFAMHDCEPAKSVNSTNLHRYEDLALDLKALTVSVGRCSKALAAAGDTLQRVGGLKGNQVALAHQKEMIASYKNLYAEIQALPYNGEKRADALLAAIGDYKRIKKIPSVIISGPLVNQENVSDQVRATITKNLNTAVENAREALPVITPIYEKCDPTTGVEGNKTDDYHSPVGDHDASCNGEVIQPVQFVWSEAQCANLCRQTLNPKTCVGYQFYAQSEDNEGKDICMRFATITNAMVYKPKDKEHCGTFVAGQCRIPVINEVLAKHIKQDFIYSCPAEPSPPEPKCPVADLPDLPCQRIIEESPDACEADGFQHHCPATCGRAGHLCTDTGIH